MYNKNLEQIADDIKPLLREYSLCDYCIGRIFAGRVKALNHKRLGNKIRAKMEKKPANSCYICKNLFSKLGSYVDKMSETSKSYQFSTFLIGAIVQPSILDRDDSIRSKFKLRGIVSIKNEITREMGKRFSRKTSSRVDYQNPDITFTVNFKKDTCEIMSKAVFLQGRYTKNLRGLAQKQKPCNSCDGKGCFQCDFHGIKEFDSVEGKIVKYMIEKFDVRQVKITWIGSEDSSSLVMGKGRPFFARLIQPHKRNIMLPQKIELDGISIHRLSPISKVPDLVRFRTKVMMVVQSETEIIPDNLDLLARLTDEPIIISDKPGGRSKKRIYDVKFKQESGNLLTIIIESDGGLPIKRFVEGQGVNPSISDILQTHCKCEVFDFQQILIKK